jgi:hypothetical protein
VISLTDPTGKGFITSEFAKGVGGMVVVGLLSYGIIQASDTLVVDAASRLITDAFTGVSAFLTIGWMVTEYMKGRKDIKVLMIEKGLVPDTEEVEEESPSPEVTTAPVVAPVTETVG